MKNNSINVKGKAYNSEFTFLEKDLLFFDRVHNRDKISMEVDAFPNMWALGIAEVNHKRIEVVREGQVIKGDGLWATFISPFAMVKWRLYPGIFKFCSYLSMRELPTELRDQAFAFPWQQEKLPVSFEEIVSLLKNVKGKVPIDNVSEYNSTACKIKQVIDQDFNDHELSIAEIAERVGVSHAFLSRIFKKTYGITPVAYRNRLRIFESSKLMLFGNYNVTSAGHEVGFLDSARFHKQFRTEMNAVPSAFCLGKKRERLIHDQADQQKVKEKLT